jgi:hypothetical protein
MMKGSACLDPDPVVVNKAMKVVYQSELILFGVMHAAKRSQKVELQFVVVAKEQQYIMDGVFLDRNAQHIGHHFMAFDAVTELAAEFADD